MKKNKEIKAETSRQRLDLPYYNNYPEDDLAIEIVDEDADKQKRRKTLTITLSVLSGVLVILAVAGFFVLKQFYFYPRFADALEATVVDMLPDTEFDFAKFEGNGQSTVSYSYDGTSVSYWETHNKADSSMRLTVNEGGTEKIYKKVVSGGEFAVTYGGEWYGTTSKNASAMLDASHIAPSSSSDVKLTGAEGEQLLTYLEYLAKASSAGKDVKIAANFVDQIFESSSISVSEDFHGLYGILGSDRYVKSRTYAINNANLAEFIKNFVSGIKVADPTVQNAVKRTVIANYTQGGETFDEFLDGLSTYADELTKAEAFTALLEICYSGNKLSAILLNTETTVSEEEKLCEQLIFDFYSNGFKMFSEKKTVAADGTESDKETSEIQMTAQFSDSGAAYKVLVNTEGVESTLNLTLNSLSGKFRLSVSVLENELFVAEGVYSDTKEQFDIKIMSVTKNGAASSDIQFALTCYYRTTDIVLPGYRDILAMDPSHLEGIRSTAFDWSISIPENGESLREEAYKFFGIKDAVEKAKKDALKAQSEAQSN